MTDPSRKTLVDSLMKVNPDAPRAFYEAMDDQSLRTEFHTVVNSMQDRVREHVILNV